MPSNRSLKTPMGQPRMIEVSAAHPKLSRSDARAAVDAWLADPKIPPLGSPVDTTYRTSFYLTAEQEDAIRQRYRGRFSGVVRAAITQHYLLKKS